MSESQSRQGAIASQQPLAVRVGAEFAGSFFVCFAIYMMYSISAILFGVNMPFYVLATALAYAAVTAMFSKISGGQINPAVTIASMLTNATAVLDGILYIIAQVLGATAAAAVLRFILPTNDTVTLKTWFSTAVNGFDSASPTYSILSSANINFGVTMAIVAELIAGLIIVGTALRTSGAHCHGAGSHARAWSIGAAYGVATTITYPITGAALNPARSTGIALLGMNADLTQNPVEQLWVFWICPVLAAAIVSLVVIVARMIASNATRPTNAVAVDTTQSVEAAEETASEETVTADSEDADTDNDNETTNQAESPVAEDNDGAQADDADAAK